MTVAVLNGGYRIPYDAAPALLKLQTDREVAIEELWENLYHQGDVDLASYAAVPDLVQMGELSLVGAIEVARHEPKNPPLRSSMIEVYSNALESALSQNPEREEDLIGYYVIHSCIAGNLRLAKALNLMDINEVLGTYA